MSKIAVHPFPKTFAHLGPAGEAESIEVTESFWPDLMSGKLDLGPGRLVSLYAFNADWDSWEAHPDGDELVCLISGAMDLELEVDGGVETASLREAGEFVIIPRGVWHTSKVPESCRALFITAGEGTEHRPA